MSISSVLQPDRSELLAKRFASLACSYLTRPEEARSPSAQIPLANLFRVLEMFRYEAFSDEPTGSIMDTKEIESTSLLERGEPWHTKIEQALNQALASVFGDIPKDQAIVEIEAVLRWLASDTHPPSDRSIARARKFLERFENSLN